MKRTIEIALLLASSLLSAQTQEKPKVYVDQNNGFQP